VDIVDINSIGDLAALQIVVTQITEDLAQGKLSTEDAQWLLTKLQDRYLELTDIAQQHIETQFAVLEKSLDVQSTTSYSLPFWAKKLWMTEPKGMELNTVLSKQYTNEEGYSSTILVYKSDYEIALQQAEILAEKADLHLSKTFQQGQTIAKQWNAAYISGLDVEWLKYGVVYVNHDLLDKNVETFLSVSVDYDWTLVVEATKYK
jgi:hypothetical protein